MFYLLFSQIERFFTWQSLKTSQGGHKSVGLMSKCILKIVVVIFMLLTYIVTTS